MAALKWTEIRGPGWTLHYLMAGGVGYVEVYHSDDGWPRVLVHDRRCDGGSLTFIDVDTARCVAEVIAVALGHTVEGA